MNVLVLQGFIVEALKASPEVAALVGDRVYDLVPADAEFPYIAVGTVIGEVEEFSDCCEIWTARQQMHVWSRTPGFPEAKTIAAACDAALDQITVPLNGFSPAGFRTIGQIVERDGDGLTSHATLEYEAHYLEG